MAEYEDAIKGLVTGRNSIAEIAASAEVCDATKALFLFKSKVKKT